MLGLLTTLVTGGIGMAKSWLTSKGEQELAKQESKKIAIEAEATVKKAAAEAKAKAMVKRMEGDIAWENTMAQGTLDSWKDEWFTVLLSSPYIVCLLPSIFTVFVEPSAAPAALNDSFDAMRKLPDAWHVMTGTACTASFGIKKATNFFSLKKGI